MLVKFKLKIDSPSDKHLMGLNLESTHPLKVDMELEGVSARAEVSVTLQNTDLELGVRTWVFESQGGDTIEKLNKPNMDLPK